MSALAPGFLIAMPQLGDPNFTRSVILMIEHGKGGSMGLVVNRAAPLTMKELAENQSFSIAEGHAPEAVYVGGPVEPMRGFVLHDSERVEERHEILPGLFLSVTLDALRPLLQDPAARVRFCLGYSGWGPGQIEHEIAEGAWLFTEAGAESVLGTPADELWDQTLRGMGVDPAMLSTAKGIN